MKTNKSHIKQIIRVLQPKQEKKTLSFVDKRINTTHINSRLGKIKSIQSSVYNFNNRNTSRSLMQLKIENHAKKNNKEKIESALAIVRKNKYGQAIYGYLDKLKNTIKIVDSEVNNASKDEVRINAAGENLDSTILHEMTHVVHANIDSDQFDLGGIYRNLIKLYADMKGIKSPLDAMSFEGYFNKQEEELVTQEWESKYNVEENKMNNRTIPVRKHYMDEERFTNGENTGRLSNKDSQSYATIYSVEPPLDIERLNSYNDFLILLNKWKEWINTYIKEEYIPSTIVKWKKEQLLEEGIKYNKNIDEKIASINKILELIPSQE